jgi:hypothetical protein
MNTFLDAYSLSNLSQKGVNHLNRIVIKIKLK